MTNPNLTAAVVEAAVALAKEWHNCRNDPACRTCALRRSIKAYDAAERGGDDSFPCAKCGMVRTKAEGGKCFTVCDACWEEKPIEISEAMIDAAMIAYDDCYRVNFEAIRGPMTAALKAALAAMRR